MANLETESSHDRQTSPHRLTNGLRRRSGAGPDPRGITRADAWSWSWTRTARLGHARSDARAAARKVDRNFHVSRDLRRNGDVGHAGQLAPIETFILNKRQPHEASAPACASMTMPRRMRNCSLPRCVATEPRSPFWCGATFVRERLAAQLVGITVIQASHGRERLWATASPERANHD